MLKINFAAKIRVFIIPRQFYLFMVILVALRCVNRGVGRKVRMGVIAFVRTMILKRIWRLEKDFFEKCPYKTPFLTSNKVSQGFTRNP